MKTKTLQVRRGLNGDWVPLATFRLDGDRVITEWASDQFRQQVEQFGIPFHDPQTHAPQPLYPSAGRAFFDGIDEAYGRNIMMKIESSESS